MTAKRGATDLSGVLLVDKPSGCTSHDVVNRVRRITGERRVGHAGTLDPLATGLLVVLVGPAARLGDYLTGQSKRYETVIEFGSSTDTDDAEGSVIATADVAPTVFEPDYAQSVLDGFLGESMQMPPAYSAIKVGGRTAHKAARAGESLDLAPRAIVVHEARLIESDAGSRTWRVEFAVSKGTYIRSLARDIGVRAETVAHVGALRRTASGALEVADAVTLEQLEAGGTSESVSMLFADPADMLRSLDSIVVEADDISSGRSLDNRAGIAEGRLVAVFLADGRLAALYRSRGEKLASDTVFAIPVGCGKPGMGART